MWRSFLRKPLRLPSLFLKPPEPGTPAIFNFNRDRDSVIDEVVGRITERYEANAGTGTATQLRTKLEYTLNEAAYLEIRRLESQRDYEREESLGYWKGLARSLAKMSDLELSTALRATVRHMAKDVAGNFDPRVYKVSTNLVPKLLTGVMQPSALPTDLLVGSDRADQLLTVQGHGERLRKLEKKGTLVYVPTHSSNMDSLVLGFAIERQGLAPAVYGAGKNLFTNPLISFFMHNLGAYRVDRRVRAALYKDVLKAYSSVMVERGYHSLFFPGGTRSRSGMIEHKLKLGLAGSALEARARNLSRGIDRPVFFVPTTVNYALVLEAETLIEDWLSESGKARYIIEDDEFSQLDRWVSFFRKGLHLQSACILRFGAPIDPYGNEVDDEGRSIDPQGRPFASETYTWHKSAPRIDHERDAAYTRLLADHITERYLRETVIMSTQLVAHVLFRRVVKESGSRDLFSQLRLRGQVQIARPELVASIGFAREQLRQIAERGRVHLSPRVSADSPEQLLDRALDAWNGYHTKAAALSIDNAVRAEDTSLLLYYQNRLIPWAVEIAPDDERGAAQQIAELGGRR